MGGTYAASDGLKRLLRHFGAVVVTVTYYSEHRLQGEVYRPGENFGMDVTLEQGEPALVVRITSGDSRIRSATT
ncbi:hypothetical protein [Phenylobacterium sp.]|uniref:hypothetical protein n=1 Tax=Phenylobacterium sp. TaxID=1871053 RepID=UPI00391A0437